MATPRQYAIREVALATFYSLTTGKPLVHLDTLKTSGVENTAETIYARGGSGNAKLVGFSSNREGKITLQDAVFTNEVMALMTGNDMITGAKEIFKREILTVSAGLTISLSKTPVGTPLKVAKLLTNGGDGTEFAKDTVLGAGKYTISSKTITFNTGDVVQNDQVVVYYKINTDATATTMKVTSNKFGGSYKVVLDCLVRDLVTKADYAAQIIIYNAKMEDNWSFSFSPDGDPAVLDIPLEMLKSPTNTDFYDMVVYDESLAI
jgi:hypothetical protein